MAFLFWLGIRGARNAVVRPNAFLRRKSAAFSACNAENTRKCNRHGGGAAAGVSRLSFHFPFSKNECIFAVMRPDPDLTQTGAKTRWIYRDLFDKTARIFLERYKSNPASGGQFMPLAVCCLWFFPWFSVILSEKTRMQRKPGVFPLARYQSCRMEFPDGSESGEIIVYRHRF